MRELAVAVGQADMAGGATPGLDERRSNGIRLQRSQGTTHVAVGKLWQVLPHELARPLHFQVPDVGSCKGVAGVPGRDGNLAKR